MEKQSHTREEKMQAFGRLLDIQDRLRKDCPWDRKQTYESLRPNTIEEVYELCDALIKGNQKEICKELGDVMEHVVFYAMLGQETGDFDIADVCNAQADKTVLSGVPESLPSLIKAYRIQDKARNVGFDWKQKEDVWDKVREELGELEVELKKEDKDKSIGELGDFLFSIINAARLYHLNPDNALERTNQKFIHRFAYVERKAKEKHKQLKDMTIEEMDKLWNEAKTIENNI